MHYRRIDSYKRVLEVRGKRRKLREKGENGHETRWEPTVIDTNHSGQGEEQWLILILGDEASKIRKGISGNRNLGLTDKVGGRV
ncbi:hypothetical protein VNO77_41460 [Canavalia gladiata]|uniref:Uncharacterized protein n=1 Tax=Canavalia gladiata TaxID=3824 RepID=A0AAN9PS32_CANGL